MNVDKHKFQAFLLLKKSYYYILNYLNTYTQL